MKTGHEGRKPKPRHECAAFGCKKWVPFDFLMCARHWKLVPRELQTAVYREWNGGKRTKAWDGAVDAAVAAIAHQGDLFEPSSRGAR